MPSVLFIPPADSSWRSVRLVAPLGIPGLLGECEPCAEASSAMLLPGGEFCSAIVARPSASVRINGRPVTGGLRVLADRDEIQVDGFRFYYAARDPLEIEAYPGPAATCPRCTGVIRPGTAAVRCHCGAWFHQSSEFTCFTYGESCPSCNGPTQLYNDPWDPSTL